MGNGITRFAPPIERSRKVCLLARPYGDDYSTSDGTCVRDYVHVADIARAHVSAIGCDVSGVFNLGSGIGYSVKEIIAAGEDATGCSIPVTHAARRPGDPDRLIASAARAQKMLGWQPQWLDIKKMIESAWRWHALYPNGYAE